MKNTTLVNIVLLALSLGCSTLVAMEEKPLIKMGGITFCMPKGTLKKEKLNDELCKAAMEGRLDIIQHLVSHGADSNAYSSKTYDNGTETDVEGLQPIHFAAREGHQAVIEWLVNRGADVNAWTKYYSHEIDKMDPVGRQPIHFAASKGHLAIVKWLVMHGADIYARDGEDQCLMHYAAMGDYQALSQWLVNHRRNERLVLIRWLNRFNADTQQTNIRATLTSFNNDAAGISAPANKGIQPIHLAAAHGSQTMVQSFIDCGIDISVRDSDRYATNTPCCTAW